MSKTRKKTRRDVAEIARANLEQIIGEKLTGEPLDPSASERLKRDRSASASKGGKARAAKLTPTKRKAIAKKAAAKRWGGA